MDYRNCTYLANGEMKCKEIERFTDSTSTSTCCQKHSLFSMKKCKQCVKKNNDYVDASDIFEKKTK